MTLEPLLRDHPFLSGLEPEYLALLAGCAANVRSVRAHSCFVRVSRPASAS
jgi:hypothetical protein